MGPTSTSDITFCIYFISLKKFFGPTLYDPSTNIINSTCKFIIKFSTKFNNPFQRKRIIFLSLPLYEFLNFEFFLTWLKKDDVAGFEKKNSFGRFGSGNGKIPVALGEKIPERERKSLQEISK